LKAYAQKQNKPPTQSSTHLTRSSPVRLQAKLRVNTPGDIYEQEADRVAEGVTDRQDSHVESDFRSGHSNRLDDRYAVRRKGVQDDSAPIEAPPIVEEVLRSSGQSLDASTRSFMEQRFGHDFSRVRVHTDARAAASAQALGAWAYTINSHVAFGPGQYQPDTIAGRKLLAHELTHVIQQAHAPRTGRARDMQKPLTGQREFENPRILPISIGLRTGTDLRRQSIQEGEKGKSLPAGPFIIPKVVVTARQTDAPVPVKFLPHAKDSSVLKPDNASVKSPFVDALPSQTPAASAGGDAISKLKAAVDLVMVADVTFVEVKTPQELLQNADILNHQITDVLARLTSEAARNNPRLHANADRLTSPDLDRLATQAEAVKAQMELKRVFGEGWGAFFWNMRGGGQSGADAPIWKMLDFIHGTKPPKPVSIPQDLRFFRRD
jgi:hypothetical protein